MWEGTAAFMMGVAVFVQGPNWAVCVEIWFITDSFFMDVTPGDHRFMVHGYFYLHGRFSCSDAQNLDRHAALDLAEVCPRKISVHIQL